MAERIFIFLLNLLLRSHKKLFKSNKRRRDDLKTIDKSQVWWWGGLGRLLGPFFFIKVIEMSRILPASFQLRLASDTS